MKGSEPLAALNFYRSLNCQPLTFRSNQRNIVTTEEQLLCQPMQSKEPHLFEEQPPILSYYA